MRKILLLLICALGFVYVANARCYIDTLSESDINSDIKTLCIKNIGRYSNTFIVEYTQFGEVKRETLVIDKYSYGCVSWLGTENYSIYVDCN
jgi:hypothetical protein